MQRILRLPESLINRIAAGEVVERPASVVKELVENSLDARAREISIWVEGSGTGLIRITDDGEGISSEELPLAVERHATSKLVSDEDLFNLSTLGFRGEALPSIASVSRLEVTSRLREAEIGGRLQVVGGKRGEVVPVGIPPGTTVEVRDLFFNVPPRRKFLKSPATELSHICDVVNHLVLSHRDVHFRLHHGGKLLCEYAAAGSFAERLEQVLGADIASGMTPFSRNARNLEISGFLSTAPSSYPNARYLLTFVNGRYVRDRLLRYAVLVGYETLLMKGRYPAAVVYLEIATPEVDVNVHPAKYEVRFRRQGEVRDAVAEAVRQGLRLEAKREDGAEELSRPPSMGVREPAAMYEGRQRTALGPLLPLGGEIQPRMETERRSPRGFFSSLEVMGQLLGCYIVCESLDGMALIDQHAAHERVVFERMKTQLEQRRIERQELLMPQLLDLSHADLNLLEQWQVPLERVGFVLERFGPNQLAVRAVPGLLPPGDYREVVRRMIAELAQAGQSRELERELEERLMTIACHGVIRAKRRLRGEEIRALLGQLDEIDFATQCPHGRPVLIEFSQSQLDRLFKRV